MKMNQTDKVLLYLVKQAHINKFRAQGELHVNDLRKCISNIRAMGFEIRKNTSENFNKQSYTNYGLSAKCRSRAADYLKEKHGLSDEELYG